MLFELAEMAGLMTMPSPFDPAAGAVPPAPYPNRWNP